MDQIKYSVAVKLVGHDSDVGPGYSTARYLIAQEPIGLWTRNILEGNDNSWLLEIILRHPDVRERRSDVCLVRCGKGYHILVTFDGTNAPRRGALIATISIDLFLAMNQGGNFLEDSIQDFGVLRDGSLFDHIRSGIDSGFNLGDLRIFVHPRVHAASEPYIDSIERGRLVRFHFTSGSWNLLGDIEVDDLEPPDISRTTSDSLVTVKNGKKRFKPTISNVVTTVAEPTKEKIDDESRQGKKKEKKMGKISIPNGKNESHEAKSINSIDNDETSREVNNLKSTALLSATAARKSNVAASSCFYAPFCQKLAKDCGGVRKGLCKEVNSGKVTIPNDHEFLEEKRKLKNKRKKERKEITRALLTEQSEAAHQETSDPVINDSKSIADNPKASVAMFNPREYLLLHKAWNNQLSANDMKDSGETFTKKDCIDASTMLNDATNAFQKNGE